MEMEEHIWDACGSYLRGMPACFFVIFYEEMRKPYFGKMPK